MRIAVIGSGIAGLASAWWLDGAHEVTLFEANDYLGGHTHTHALQVDGMRSAIPSPSCCWTWTNWSRSLPGAGCGR